jgi:hypothetical protein
MQEMNRLNAQASKAMFDQSLAGAKQYLDAMNQMRPGQEQAQNIGTETQAGIAKIVDTVIPSPASDATTNEAAKAPEDITKAANQQEDLIEKVAAQMSQTSEQSSQSNSRKPAR